MGSSTAFREYGTALRGLVDRAPSHLHRYPDAGHFRVELSPGPSRMEKTASNHASGVPLCRNDGSPVGWAVSAPARLAQPTATGDDPPATATRGAPVPSAGTVQMSLARPAAPGSA
ncbi:hypothetical protein GCM10010207_80810 [Streptomyces atratus]|nr:hypothetical protein GCM10010207_80810 [Streptomyces atratus]